MAQFFRDRTLLDYYTVTFISHHNRADYEACPVRYEKNNDFGNFFRLYCASNSGAFAVLTEELAPVRPNNIEPRYDTNPVVHHLQGQFFEASIDLCHTR
jgi:hypothetical protein